MYQALYRKWRPRTFDDVTGQEHITTTLKRQVQDDRLSHAYLFTGTRGTGKTSCAKILARAVNCEHPMDGNPCNECPACRGIEDGSVMDVLELDAASNNGVDQVRALRDEAIYSPAGVRKRVYIVDEVHMLSTPAFNALLKILEEPPAHLMFILATTELHKVPATIQSRCQQFAFKRLSVPDIAARLDFVANQEGISLSPEGAALLARLANGGMRDALSLLDQCATGADGNALDEAAILDSLGLAGNIETAGLMSEIIKRDTGAALEHLDRLYAAGKDVGSLLNELSSLARDLLLRKTAPRGGAGLLNGGYDEQTLSQLSDATIPRLFQILTRLQDAAAGLGRSANRRTDAELCLLRLCDETLDDSAAGLSARLARLEEQLAKGNAFVSAPPAQAVTAQGVPPRRETSGQPPPSRAAVLTEREPPANLSDNEDSRNTPPPMDDDAPPFDPDPPRSDSWESDSPPARLFQAESAATPSSFPPRGSSPPAPEQPSAAPVAGSFWTELAAGLRGKAPQGEYSFLSNPSMVWGSVDGSVLTLWTQNDLVRNLLNKPAVLTPVEQAASRLLGAPCRAVVTVGTPPRGALAEEKRDKLDDLLARGRQFGDIITEE